MARTPEPFPNHERTSSPALGRVLRVAGIGIATLAFIGGALATWAFWLEPASLRVSEYELRIPEWPTGCDSMRIAVLSDIHVGSPYQGLDKMDDIVRVTLGANPDLILLTGDYVIQGVLGGQVTSPEALSERLVRLQAPLGVFAVLGNHDWVLGRDRVRQALEGIGGMTVLEDEAAEVAQGGCRLWLAGISDYWHGAHDVQRALSDVPPGAPVVAFTHNPDVFPQIPSRVALTVAGHTHGGQVVVPFLGRPVVPSRYGQRFAIGHIRERGRDLFVSSGLGTSILPVRFRVPPEVSLLTVTSGRDES